LFCFFVGGGARRLEPLLFGGGGEDGGGLMLGSLQLLQALDSCCVPFQLLVKTVADLGLKAWRMVEAMPAP